MVARGQSEGGSRRELSVAGRASGRTPALEEMFCMLALWVVTLCSARCQRWRKLGKCYKRWFCITVACASMITSKYKKFKQSIRGDTHLFLGLCVLLHCAYCIFCLICSFLPLATVPLCNCYAISCAHTLGLSKFSLCPAGA